MEQSTALLEELSVETEMPLASSQTASPSTPPAPSVVPQDCGCGGSAGTDAAPVEPTFVLSLGRIRTAFPSSSVEAEFGQANWLNLPIQPSLTYLILSQPRNAYLARSVCWIHQINAALATDATGAPLDTYIDSYLVKPQTIVELNALIAALDPAIQTNDVRYTVVQGLLGPLATASACNGLQLPFVLTNRVQSFTRSSFLIQVQTLASIDTVAHAAVLFDQMLLAASNTGNTDSTRAVNWLTLQTTTWDVYKLLATMQGYTTDTNSVYRSPGSFELVSSRAQVTATTPRKLVEVLFTFREFTTGELIGWSCLVDVSGEYPFFARYFSRYCSCP